MSDAPISVAEGVSPEVLGRAGWTNAELIWEQIQAAAAECDARGEADEAAELWAGALDVARAHLSSGDPRLATSLANHAIARRRAGDGAQSEALFAQALAVWDGIDEWLERLRPEARARSSTFHLRLESKHRGAYARFSRERYAALAAEGRSAIVAALGGASGASDRLSRWRGERPSGFNDLRKLMAAVLLIADA